jgi:hypothetical protein
LIILGAAFEGILKIAALADIKRRPASEVRGSKVLARELPFSVQKAAGHRQRCYNHFAGSDALAVVGPHLFFANGDLALAEAPTASSFEVKGTNTARS